MFYILIKVLELCFEKIVADCEFTISWLLYIFWPPDDTNCTPLHWAVLEEDESRVKLLLEKGGNNIDSVDCRKNTPLYSAVRKNCTTIAKLLLEKGANPNYIDPNSIGSKYGATPLDWAATAGNTDIVKALLEKGAVTETNVLTGQDVNSLQLAVNHGHKTAVKLLLQYGADPNVKMNYGYYKNKTLLKLVAKNNHKLKALLKLELACFDKNFDEVAFAPFITDNQIHEFVNWKVETPLLRSTIHNTPLLYKKIQELFTLNKFLYTKPYFLNNPIKNLLEEKIKKYVGNQDLEVTEQPILTLKILEINLFPNDLKEELNNKYNMDIPLNGEVIEQ